MSRCKDCEPGSKRPAPYPGPRCFTHDKAKKAEESKKRHETRVTATYGLGPGEYDALLAAQGGACAICRRRFKYRLDTDHDHKTGTVRMLACKSCNRHVLRYARNDPAVLRRAAEMLEDPVAVQVLGFRGVISNDMEIWRDIPGTQGWYQCSNYGRVRCWYTSNQYASAIRRAEPNILNPFTDRYLYVNLSVNKKRRKAGVHSLVLETFAGPAPGLKACHYNGEKHDNRLSNLYWGTDKDNSDDASRLGERPRGEAHGCAKLTERKVIEIREAHEVGAPTATLARRYGVSETTIRDIYNRKTWKHVGQEEEHDGTD